MAHLLLPPSANLTTSGWLEPGSARALKMLQFYLDLDLLHLVCVDDCAAPDYLLALVSALHPSEPDPPRLLVCVPQDSGRHHLPMILRSGDRDCRDDDDYLIIFIFYFFKQHYYEDLSIRREHCLKVALFHRVGKVGNVEVRRILFRLASHLCLTIIQAVSKKSG